MSELRDRLLAGPQDAATLQAWLNVSQATLSRQINRDDQIIQYGRARATRYALRRPLRDVPEFPLWQISDSGQSQSAGRLIGIWPAGSYLYQSGAGEWRYCDGLPWFLNDMRPQGFLGRAWGRECARLLQLPEDIRQWQDDHCLLALSVRGSDLPGSMIVGEESYRRWLQQELPSAIILDQRSQRFPQIAREALAGEEPGSSAGGEQPKFPALLQDADGTRFHALVKFTPAHSNENSQRWCDLLRAEALALRLMNQHGLAAATADLVTSAEGQLFLQVRRFDRPGERGRRAMISLEAVQAEFIGQLSRWPQALTALVAQQLLSEEDARRGALQWAFGCLIANSDMHAGNLSFFTDQTRLALTPAYDMLPMRFAPNGAGHMHSSAVAARLDTHLSRAVWQVALELAQIYWDQIAGDGAWSEDFRQLAQAMSAELAQLAPQIARMA